MTVIIELHPDYGLCVKEKERHLQKYKNSENISCIQSKKREIAQEKERVWFTRKIRKAVRKG